MDFNDPFDFHPTVPDVGFNKFIKELMGSVPAEGEMTP
jgi:hypothetical protein